jgi:hypothetical protein
LVLALADFEHLEPPSADGQRRILSDIFEKKWLRGFVLSLKGETRILRSKFLLFNSPLHHLSHLLGQKDRKLSRWKEKIQPRYTLFPVFLGIDEKVVPVGMKDLVVSILDPEKPYGDGCDQRRKGRGSSRTPPLKSPRAFRPEPLPRSFMA